MVGPCPILGLRAAEVMDEAESSVVDVTLTYRNEGWPGCDEWYVVSVDHAGNPVGVARDGSVWLSDHDAGETARVADSFEGYLRDACLQMGAG